MKLLFQHPNTISSVSTDGFHIATADFNGWVRVIDEFGGLKVAEQRASQLNAVALRDGVVASDDDLSTIKTGVAITTAGQIIKGADFVNASSVLAIDKTGRYAVCSDLFARDRLTSQRWQVIPATEGHDKWPMGVEMLGASLATVGLDGWLRVWTDQTQTNNRFVAGNGCNSLDVSPDGTRIAVSHWGKTAGSNPVPGITILDSSLNVIFEAVENGNVVHAVRFLPDNRVVYGTHDGRLCIWDGASPISEPTPVVSAPGKPKKGRPR